MPGTYRKMIAPAIISLLILVYYLFIVRLLFLLALPGYVKALILVVPLGVAAGLAIVLAERIKEIRSGEEDDLSKY
jgi:hypothetical protein